VWIVASLHRCIVLRDLRPVRRRLKWFGLRRSKTEELMLDIHARDPTGRALPLPYGVEFVRIELAPLADGRVFASLTATTVDENEPQLLDQEIACENVASIEDVLALIRAHLSIGNDRRLT
jgi:hypothetical protein